MCFHERMSNNHESDSPRLEDLSEEASSPAEAELTRPGEAAAPFRAEDVDDFLPERYDDFADEAVARSRQSAHGDS
jgi:hypothetical protein